MDAQSLASSLAPALVSSTGGRLRNIRWFRADWQRGGAATGRSIYVDDDGAERKTIVKIPVGDSELRWMRRLQMSDDGGPVVPRLYASGDALGSFDIGWIIIEELPVGPLGSHWSDNAIPRIARAAARLYACASSYQIDREPVREDWGELVRGARDSIQTNSFPDRQRWTTAVKALEKRLDHLVEEWRGRPIAGWVHGDLHPANAMCRHNGDDADVTLIDLAEIRPGHWLEDAIYLERLHWAHPDRIRKHKPVRELARAMKSIGLSPGDDYHRLAAIRRALLAATAPRFLSTEGGASHLAACLSRLESSLSELKAAGLS